MGFTSNVNGREHAVDAPEDTPLLSILVTNWGPVWLQRGASAAHVRC
ncbi:hypothetical protein MYXA107069_27200 [Myxococcus xanthus]|nr:hypothetical protein MyxoNM_31170 [Myxococcus xanthus]SDX89709.1 hypothetical protein SAMN05444383_114160 [Myxococcus xanthus]